MGNLKDFCKCVFGCEVNGGDSGRCSDDFKANVKHLRDEYADTDAPLTCDEMMCTAYCMNAVDFFSCVDDWHEGCQEFKGNTSDCDIDCDGVGPAATMGLIV